MATISQDYTLAEREPRFRAVPLDELVHRMSVASLGVSRTEAIQDRGFGLIESGNRNTVFGWRRRLPVFFFAIGGGLLDRTPIMVCTVSGWRVIQEQAGIGKTLGDNRRVIPEPQFQALCDSRLR